MYFYFVFFLFYSPIFYILLFIYLVAGNFTLSGSAANIIVAEKAIKHENKNLRIYIDSITHFKICSIVTLFLIFIGILIIYTECKIFGYIN